MNWSIQTPRLDGFYWLRREGKEDTIVKIWDIKFGLNNGGAMLSWVGPDWDISLIEVLNQFHCQWAGPILPPAA